jgi:branched-chain amino acid transport system substrate-binding protein
VSMTNNKIGTGRVYEYSPETKLFTPSSDWLST